MAGPFDDLITGLMQRVDPNGETFSGPMPPEDVVNRLLERSFNPPPEPEPAPAVQPAPLPTQGGGGKPLFSGTPANLPEPEKPSGPMFAGMGTPAPAEPPPEPKNPDRGPLNVPLTPPDTSPKFQTGGKVLNKVLGPETGMLTENQSREQHADRILEAEIARDEVAGRRAKAETDVATAGSPENDIAFYPGAKKYAEKRLQNVIKNEPKDLAAAEKTVQDVRKTPPTQERWRNVAESALGGTASIAGQAFNTLTGLIELDPTENITKQDADKLAGMRKEVNEGLAESFKGDPARAKDFETQFAQGGGSMIGFMAGGGISRALGQATASGSAALGALSQAGQALGEMDGKIANLRKLIDAKTAAGQDAKADQEALDRIMKYRGVVLFANAGLGATEAIPIERFLSRLDSGSGGIVSRILENGTKQSLEETLQEVGQQLGSNFVAKIYDENRDLFDGVADNGKVAALLGFMMGGGAGLYSGIRHPGQTEINIPHSGPYVGDDLDIQPPGPKPQPTGGAAGPETIDGEAREVPTAPKLAAPVRESDVVEPEQKSQQNEPSIEETPVKQAKTRVDEIDAADRSVLRQAGYAEDEIDGMNPTERAIAVKDAKDSGIAPGPIFEGSSSEGEGTRTSPTVVRGAADLDRGADRVAEPSDAQKEAGNYPKQHLKFQGFDVTIENPKGSVRRGPGWETTMPVHYGYIKRSTGADGDQVDAFISDKVDPHAHPFVIDQIDPKTGKFDEHKVMLGFKTREDAIEAYNGSFSDGSGPSRMGGITRMAGSAFKGWLKNGDMRKPIIGQKGVPQFGAHGSRAESQEQKSDEHVEAIREVVNAGLVTPADVKKIYGQEGLDAIQDRAGEDDVGLPARAREDGRQEPQQATARGDEVSRDREIDKDAGRAATAGTEEAGAATPAEGEGRAEQSSEERADKARAIERDPERRLKALQKAFGKKPLSAEEKRYLLDGEYAAEKNGKIVLKTSGKNEILRLQKFMRQERKDRAEMAKMPDGIPALTDLYRKTIDDYDRAVREGSKEAQALGDTLELIERKANDGETFGVATRESPAEKVRIGAAAKIGEEPKWGQIGIFRVMIDGTPYLVDQGRGVGDGIYAESPDKPFVSETGFLSTPSRSEIQKGETPAKYWERLIRAEIGNAKTALHEPDVWYRLPKSYAESDSPVQAGGEFGASSKRRQAEYEAKRAKKEPEKPKKKKPAKKAAAAQSLMQYLAMRGGLKPHGDLKAIFDGNPFVPKYGRLIRKTGMDLDKAWEAAIEGGYIDDAGMRGENVQNETDNRRVLDLLAEEAKGNRQYPLGVEAPKTAAEKETDAARNRKDIEDALASELGTDPDPALAERAVKIVESGETSDVLEAYERAIMEDDERHGKEADQRREEVAYIPGWDDDLDAGIPVSHDTEAAPGDRENLPAAESRSDAGQEEGPGEAGGRAHENGASDRTAAGEVTDDLDIPEFLRRSPDEKPKAAAEPEKAPEPVKQKAEPGKSWPKLKADLDAAFDKVARIDMGTATGDRSAITGSIYGKLKRLVDKEPNTVQVALDYIRKEQADRSRLPERFFRRSSAVWNLVQNEKIAAAPPAEKPPATEKTEAGEQMLIPGVKAVTDKDRVQALADKPMQGGNAAPGGLFGDESKQTDLMDLVRKPQAQKQKEEKPSEPDIIQDAGEKIGGARKDRWKERGLSLADLEAMMPGEQAKYTTKENVWPRPDYDAMIENGADPLAARLVHQIYNSIGKSPKIDSGEGRKNYINMIGMVRALAEKAKTIEDVKAIGPALKDEIGIRHKYQSNMTPEEKALWFSIYAKTSEPTHIGWSDERRAREDVAKGWPNIEPWKRTYRVAQFYGRDDYAIVTAAKGTRKVIEEGFKTEAEAEARAKKLYDEAPKGRGGAPLPERPHLDKIERKGPDVRKGVDIDSQDFIDDFGFRGVEFGNWVAGDERQKVVNLAYDALHDLAQTLGIPDKALSLNGSLGLAFGARGTGRARAHYEAGKLVINMTKLSGAGALAHEWGHALDHYLGELDTKNAYSGKPKSISGWHETRTYKGDLPANLRPEVREAANDLMSGLFHRTKDKAEVVRDRELALEKLRANMERSRKAIERLEGMDLGNSTEAKNHRKWLTDIADYEKTLAKKLEEARGEDFVSTEKTKTSFVQEAEKLSGQGDYWRRPNELFARSFEAYVFDKASNAGVSTPYLVHGVEGDRYKDHERGNPYPEGIEREAINAAYDRLFGALKLREGKLGPDTVLYSQGMNRDVTETPAFKRWFGDSKVVDAKGKPLVVYKGMYPYDWTKEAAGDPGPEIDSINRPGDFPAFNKGEPGIQIAGFFGAADVASRFAEIMGTAGSVYPVYLSLQNPYEIDAAGERAGKIQFGESGKTFRDAIRSGKYDGAIIRNTSDEGTIYIALKPTQIKSVFNRGTFDPNDPSILASQAMREPAPAFYSAVERAIEGAKMEKAIPTQWLGTLKNLPGVKVEELQWLGLEPWLRAQNRTVTKQEVLDYVRANQIEVRDVMKGAEDADSPVGTIRQSTTKYGSYTLPGGQNYRELLLTLPVRQTPESRSIGAQAAEFARAMRDKYGERWAFLASEDENRTYNRFILDQENAEPKKYESSHWPGVTNPVAHVRFNDRTIDGKRTLFIEEVQSDWHQQGRKHGYSVPGRDAELKAEYERLDRRASDIAEELSVRMQKENDFGFKTVGAALRAIVNNDDFESQWKRIDPETARLTRAYRDARRDANAADIRRDQNRLNAIPDAPFKTTWPELVMKRMIRYAAENGYDKVAWTPGNVQANRYSLAKQVRSVAWNAETGELQVLKYDGKISDLPKTPKEKLADTVGKEAAEKLIAMKPNISGFKTLTGDNLYVGGEGMRAFYDKMLPDKVNKLVGKFGAKVGRGPMKSETSFQKWVQEQYGRDYRDQLSPQEISNLRDEWMEKGENLEDDHIVHQVEITPALREAAMGGFPLFQQSTGPGVHEDRSLEQQEIERRLTEIVRRVAGHGPNLSFVGDLGTSKPTVGYGRNVEEGVTAGEYHPTRNLIRLSLASNELEETAYHESFHSVEMALLTDRELQLLQSETERLRAYLKTKYRGARVNIDELSGVEVRAYAFQAYAADRDALDGGRPTRPGEMRPGAGMLHVGVRRIFDKIAEILRRIRNYLRGLGYETANDVFEKAFRGEYAASRQQGDQIKRFREAVANHLNAMEMRGDETLFAMNMQGGRGFQLLPETASEAMGRKDIPWTQRIGHAIDAAGLPANRALGDRLVDIRRLQIAAEIADGGTPLSESLDTALAATIFQGRAESRIKEWYKEGLQIARDMQAAGISQSDMSDYLYARHAPERNARIAQINPQMPDGGSGMTNAQAASILNALGGNMRATMESFAQRWDAMLAKNLQMMLDYGLEDKATINNWSSQYDHYVPLRGFDDAQLRDENSTMFPYMSRGYDVRGPESKQAFGRQTKADSIIATILSMGERTIVRGEKNKVAKTFLRFVRRYPHPDLYKIEKTETARRINPKTGLVESSSRAASVMGDNVIGVKTGGETTYIHIEDENLARALKSIGGEAMPAFLRLLGAITREMARFHTARNPEFFVGNVIRDIQDAAFTGSAEQRAGLVREFTKNVASLRTYVAAALHAAGVQPDPTTRKGRLAALVDEYEKNGGQIAQIGYRDINDVREMLRAEIDQIEQGIARRALGQLNPNRNVAIRAITFINEVLETGTRLAIYDAARKSGMTPAKSAELSKESTTNFNTRGNHSSTANALLMFFNARVQGGLKIPRLLRRSKRARRIAMGLIALGFITTLYNLAVSPPFDDDEEERRRNGKPFKTAYEMRPYWERERNCMLFLPGDTKPYKLPIGYGLQIFYMLGENAAMTLMGKVSPLKAAIQWGSTTFNAFSPMSLQIESGSVAEYLRMVMPQAAMPFYEIAINRNWLGRPIRPDEKPWTQGMPRSQDHFASTSPYAVATAQWLNKATGGNAFQPGSIDMHPDTLDYLVGFAFGGFGNFAKRSTRLGFNLVEGIDTPPEQVPFLRMFRGGGPENVQRDLYYQGTKEAMEGAQQARRAGKALAGGEHEADAQTTLNDLSGKLGMGKGPRGGVKFEAEQIVKDSRKVLKELREEEKTVRENPALSRAERGEQVRDLRQQQLDVMNEARWRLRRMREEE